MLAGAEVAEGAAVLRGNLRCTPASFFLSGSTCGTVQGWGELAASRNMSSEALVLIGLVGDQIPEGDKTQAEELSKFGGRPVRLKPDDSCISCSIGVKCLAGGFVAFD